VESTDIKLVMLELLDVTRWHLVGGTSPNSSITSLFNLVALLMSMVGRVGSETARRPVNDRKDSCPHKKR
jgi:hypothetical protein